jgi:curved DNA-binding protein CbpA
MNINPYELLGLSVDSNIKDLRKAYYEFSLLCHPDKGGNSEEMDVVHKSYKYIKNQLENCQNKSSYRDLEKEFELFCKEQENNTPCFSDIYDEANDFIRKFNTKFVSERENNPFDNGYGKYMENTSIKQDYNDNDAEDFYKPLENNFKQDIVIYKEPCNLPNTYGEQFHLNAKEVKDYSHSSNNLSMTDYKIAFNDNTNLDQLIKNEKTGKTLEELIEERENDFISQFNKKNVFESDHAPSDSCQKSTLINNLQTKKYNASLLIQKIFRGFKVRMFYKREKYYNDMKKYCCIDKCVIIIQKNIRKYICRKLFLEQILDNKIRKIETQIQKLKNKKRSIYNLNNKIIKKI